MPLLTIGMPTYDDFDGVYFTIQALRLYQDLDDADLLVVDNFGCDTTRAFVESIPGATYVRSTEVTGTAAAKNQVFAHATGDFVLCLDSHVLLAPDAVARLAAYCREHPQSGDLLQGPLWLDDLHPTGVATNLSQTWSGGMLGQWETDERGTDPDSPPFEILNQGMGLFACRREVWPGFNPRFRGFGGEEGYLQARIRKQGGRTLCLPFLRWVHRFGRPHGTPYKVRDRDKFRNYLIGHLEAGMDLRALFTQFTELLPADLVCSIISQEMEEGGWRYLGHDAAAVMALANEVIAERNQPEDSITSDSPPRG